LRESGAFVVKVVVRWGGSVAPLPQERALRRDIGAVVACGAINRFDQGYAPSSFLSVANGGCAVFHGVEEIFQDRLMPTNIGDRRGRCARVRVAGRFLPEVCRALAKIGRDDAIVLENHRAFRPGDLDSAWIPGLGGGCRVQHSKRATRKFKDGDGRVFGFDLV